MPSSRTKTLLSETKERSGVIRVKQAFRDLLKRSPAPRIVNVSSSTASLPLTADLDNPNFRTRYGVYQSFKSVLNMYSVNLAHQLRDALFNVNVVCTGYTKTDFTNHQATSTADEAGQRIVKYAHTEHNGPTGKFSSEDDFTVPANYPW